MILPDHVEALLTSRYQYLTDRLTAIERDRQHRDETPSPDWAKRATERANDAVLDRLSDSTLNDIAQVRHALDLIETDRYGICELCGNPITAERLRAVQQTTLCATCAGIKLPG